MPTQKHQDDVVALARNVVADVDPARSRYFDSDAEAYFSDPERALARRDPDATLGSGLEAVVVALTPFVLYVAQKVADHFTEVSIKQAVEKGTRSLTLRRRPARATPAHTEGGSALKDLSPLSPLQAEQVRQLVVNAAEVRGVDTDVANRVADAVLAHLPHRPGPSAD